MSGEDLRATITELGLSQAEFARLVGVSSRAVTLWLVEERKIPGPVEAYVRLLFSGPASLRQAEVAKSKKRSSEMRDGMYQVEYASVAGAGSGVMILDAGRAYGADPFGGKYDGDYIYDENSRKAELHLKLTFAPNAPAVFGVSNPYEWSVEVTVPIDPHADHGETVMVTPLGPKVDARYKYLRALPE